MQVGGFKAMPLLEDVDLVKRVKQRYGHPAIAALDMRTSPRRWQQLGIVRTTLINRSILTAYSLGVPVHMLAAWYNNARRPQHDGAKRQDR